MPSTIERALDKLGVETPRAVTDAHGYREAIGALAHDTSPTIERELADAIARGTFSTDEAVAAVKRASSARVARGAAVALHQDLSRSYDAVERAAIAASGDEIVRSVKPIADEAFGKLTAAIRVVGARPDSRSTSTGGTAMIEAFGAFRDALAVLQDVAAVAGELHRVRCTPAAPRDACCWLSTDTPAERIADARRIAAGEGDRFAVLLGEGFRLTLNDAHEQQSLLDALAAHERGVATRAASERAQPNPRQQRQARDWAGYVKPQPKR
jgi:hypothetical protein